MHDTMPVPVIPLTFDPTTRTYHADPLYIHDMIVAAAQHQVENSPAAQRIIGAGLEHELRNVVQQVAANAANPIADAVEAALDAHGAGPVA
jgi:hypothetical protein